MLLVRLIMVPSVFVLVGAKPSEFQDFRRFIMAALVQGKIALVTGGGSGIGRATSQIFAREGAKVVVADVVVEGGEETVRLINAAGGEAIFVKTDVSQSTDVEATVKKAVDTYG